MNDAVMETLEKHERPCFLVKPLETVTTTYSVDDALDVLSFFLEWPGSDIVLTVVSPLRQGVQQNVPGRRGAEQRSDVGPHRGFPIRSQASGR